MSRNFGAILQGLMENRGLTVEDLARATDQSYSTVDQLIRGLAEPAEGILRRIAGVLGVPVADLFVMAGFSVDRPLPPPPFPQTPGMSGLIHAASPLSSEQLRILGDLAREWSAENEQLRADFS